MTHGFQQQDPSSGFCIPKSVTSPQHGQKANVERAKPPRRTRSFEPKPGH